jgi:hypothetical protein
MQCPNSANASVHKPAPKCSVEVIDSFWMGAEGLEPSRLQQSTDFHPLAAFAATFSDLEDWTLPLPSTLTLG